MPQQAARWTAAMVRALPDDGNRYEVVDGELLVTPAPVELVLSPSTARYDRMVKRLRFQRAGIPEYWIVDVDARVIERWRPGDERPEVLGEVLSWQPAGAKQALTIDLTGLFARTHGEAL